MLDQNTDRMWYVIGAIVIGAAIIAAALFLFDNTIMESIKTMMTKLTTRAGDGVTNIGDVKVPGTTILTMLKSMPLF